MSWATSVPAALTALTAAFQTAVPGVTVLKGTVVGNSSRREVIVVGYEGGNADAVEFLIGDAGPQSQQEAYTVNCCIVVAPGGTGLDPVIVRATELFEALGATLAADQTVGGAVMRARIAQGAFRFQQSKQGAVVEVPFTVRVAAFPTR